MAENTPVEPPGQPSPEPDPWATAPVNPPPPSDAPFARPAENPWQAPEPEQAAVDNPYATTEWGIQPPPAAPMMPPPGPPGPHASGSFPPPQEYSTHPPAFPSAGSTASTGPGGSWTPLPGPAVPRDANPLAALFDFSFTKFATPGLVKIVYLLQVIAAVGTWLLWILTAFTADQFGGGGFGMGLIVLLFGWIPVMLSIAFTRFILESVVALIRIHDRVGEMAEISKGAPSA